MGKRKKWSRNKRWTKGRWRKKERKKEKKRKKRDKGEKRYEKQGIGEQWDGENLRKSREKERGKFFGQKRDHEKNQAKREDLTRWKQKVMEKVWKTKKNNKKSEIHKKCFFFWITKWIKWRFKKRNKKSRWKEEEKKNEETEKKRGSSPDVFQCGDFIVITT